MKKRTKLLACIMTVVIVGTVLFRTGILQAMIGPIAVAASSSPVGVSDARWNEPELSSQASETYNVEEAQIIGEDAERRDRFQREYLMSDGTRLLVVYPEAVHYETEEGEWEEIDNTLKNGTADGTAVLTNTAGVWDVSLPQQMTDDTQISVAKDGYALAFSLEGKYDLARP